MDRREQQLGRRLNTLTKPRVAFMALAMAVGGVVVSSRSERADAAINGITTPAKTNCSSIGRGVFRATNNSDAPVSGYLVSIDSAGNPTVVDSAFTVPAKDETVSILPTSEEDKQIVFVANDGRGVTDPTENDCIADTEPVTTTSSTVLEEEPTVTTSSVPPTTTSTTQPPSSSSPVPVTTTMTLPPYITSGETTATTLQSNPNANQVQAGSAEFIPTAPVATPSQGRALALVG